jgi:hypothetical protein
MSGEDSGARADTSSLVQGEDLFFRTEDIEFANGIADAIAGDLTSLELIGHSRAVIDHYGRLLLKRLRQHPNLELEAYLPMGVESLVDQFNAALSSITMSEATGSTNTAKPVKVFISSEISDGNSRDGRMLSRLVNNFPGANIKLIWVHQEPEEIERPEAIEFASKNAARWYVRTPTALEALRLLGDAQEAGLSTQARALLNKIDPQLVEVDREPSMRPRRFTADEPGLAAPVIAAARAAAASDNAAAAHAPERRKPSLIAILSGMFLVTCLSGIVVASLFPRNMQAIGEMLHFPPAPIKPLSPPKSTETKPATSALPGLDEAAMTILPWPVVPAPAEPAPAVVTAPANAPEKIPAIAVEKAAPPPKVLEKKETAPKVVQPAAADTEGASLQKARAAVTGAKKGVYFVQFVALDSYAAAVAWQDAEPVLSKAQILQIRVQPGSKTKFVVISGPYRSRLAATEFTAGKGVPGEFWVRAAASLQAAVKASPTNVAPQADVEKKNER